MNAIEIQGLTKRFGSRTAVDKLELQVPQGILFSLLGINGAGKTTTIKMLSGLLEPTEGDALLLGDSVVKNPHAVKERINLSPQETAVAPNLSVRENLEFTARIYGADKNEARKQAQRQMEAFELCDRAKDKARVLSGGVQRRLSIAMALISNPEILFLDEPTLGLDVIARRELWRAIEGLKGKMTIVLTTHYMEEAEALSDLVAVMQDGRLKAVGSPAELVERTGAKNFEEAFVALAGGGRA